MRPHEEPVPGEVRTADQARRLLQRIASLPAEIGERELTFFDDAVGALLSTDSESAWRATRAVAPEALPPVLARLPCEGYAWAHGMRLLSRLPRNHGIYSEILAKPWKPDGKIATGQRRRKDAAPDIYEYMGMDVTATFTIVHPEGEGQPKRSEVVLAPARAIRVFSTGLLRTKVSTLKRIRDRDQRAATVFMRDAQKRAFACEEDAKRAARRDVEAQRRTRSVNLFVGS